MNKKDAIRHNINHWVNALSYFGAGISELTVPARSTLELSDRIFDEPSNESTEIEWFHIDGRRYEIFLEDDCSMLRLANRRVLTSLQGDDSYPLVSWFSYKTDDYRLTRQVGTREFDTDELDASHIAWVAWNYRMWRSHLFNGQEVVPVSESKVVREQLDANKSAITWLGWDGENLDIFLSGFPQMDPTTMAVFVSYDRSVIAVHSKH